MRRWTVVLPGLLLAACTSSSATRAPSERTERNRPLYLVDPTKHAHPDCPPERFLAQVGSGRDAQGALMNARDKMAQTISLQISSELKRATRVSGSGGKAKVDFLDENTLEQRSAFQHAELMEPVESAFEEDGRYYQLVCMERARAVQTLQQEIASSLATFRTRSQAAREAGARADRAQFAAGYFEATREAEQCIPTMFQLAVLSGLDGGGDEEFWTELTALQTAAAELRSSTSVSVGVDAPSVPDDEQQRLQDEVARALRQSGLASSVAAACGQSTYHLSVRAEPNCKYGGLGWTCRPALAMTATECATGRTAFSAPFPSERPLAGTNTSNQEKALRKALSPVSGSPVQQWVLQGLQRELPVRTTTNPR